MALVDATPARAEPPRPPMLPQLIQLGRRSLVRLLRQPALWIPGMAFPLLFASVNSSAFSRIEDLGIFPAGTTFMQFQLAAVIIQGVLFGGINGGTELATDIQTGFLDRLLTSPVSRPAILLGRIGGSVVFALVQSILFLLVLWPFGGSIRGGLPGAVVLVVCGVLLAVAIGGVGVGLAARTGSAEAVQGFFPIIFILLFVSSCFFPTQLMSGWYRAAAEHNPLSYMAEGMRHQVIVGFDLAEAGRSVGIGGAAALLAMVFAVRGMRRRWEAA